MSNAASSPSSSSLTRRAAAASMFHDGNRAYMGPTTFAGTIAGEESNERNSSRFREFWRQHQMRQRDTQGEHEKATSVTKSSTLASTARSDTTRLDQICYGVTSSSREEENSKSITVRMTDLLSAVGVFPESSLRHGSTRYSNNQRTFTSAGDYENSFPNNDSLSFDESTLTPEYASSSSSSLEPSSPPSSVSHDCTSVLEVIGSLEDVDESYMLSVFWTAGDSAPERWSGENHSLAGNTASSHATSSSHGTSLSSYTWTTASRRRHRGAYKKRVKATEKAPIASWVDTMHESTSVQLGPLNTWTVGKGWMDLKASSWDPKPNNGTWGSLDPIFDKDLKERVEI